MALRVVSKSLIIGNYAEEVQVYDTLKLGYVKLLSFDSKIPHEIAVDGMSMQVFPSNSLVGNLEGILSTEKGIVEVSVVYDSSYKKSATPYPEWADYFPRNLIKFTPDEPMSAINYAKSTVFEEGLVPTEDLVPLAKEFNSTFPEYCDNSLLGIAMSLAVQQYKANNTNILWCCAYKNNEINAPLTLLGDWEEYGKALDGESSDGKYHAVQNSEGDALLLRYGGILVDDELTVKYIGKGKAVYISAEYSSLPDIGNYFTLDSSDPDLVIDEGLWYSSLVSLQEVLVDWENAAGVPVACELLYNLENNQELPDAEEYIVPSFTRWQEGDYTPTIWLNNISRSINFVKVKFTGKDFIIKFKDIESLDYYTLDSSLPTQVIDNSRWFTSL